MTNSPLTASWLKMPLFNFIFGSILGLAIGASAAVKLSQPAISRARETAQSQVKTLNDTIESLNETNATLQATGYFKDNVIAFWMNRAQAIEGNPAVQLLAQSGHVMNEEQCRAWIGIMAPPQTPAVTTVLYESGRASLNISLLPLPGAPRVAIGPQSELAPRWILPGRIQPQMVGETRQAMYYYFDASSNQWQGPFAPERVAR